VCAALNGQIFCADMGRKNGYRGLKNP